MALFGFISCTGGGGEPSASGGQTGDMTNTGGGDASSGGRDGSGGTKDGDGGAFDASGGKPGDNSAGGAAPTGGGTASGGTASGGTASGGTSSVPSGDTARVEGRRLFVGGKPFWVRGVNWNPVPIGGTHPGDLDYAGFADRDIALMRAAGINAVRTYERLEDEEVLDKLHENGIYVFSTIYGWWQDEPGVVTARVEAVKDHPAILAWVLGNEWNYNQLYANGEITTADARDQINAAAALIKQADPSHPIATIYGELAELSEMVAAMPDIDLWGINAYRGLSHGDLFDSFAAASDKPLFLGEYGADAYNATIDAVDEASQAEATQKLTEELMDNYVTESTGTALGGFVFEFADEWWKDDAGSPSVQDVGGIAPGGGPYPDQTFNEEYWGIVDIERNPRPAYEALKALYAR